MEPWKSSMILDRGRFSLDAASAWTHTGLGPSDHTAVDIRLLIRQGKRPPYDPPPSIGIQVCTT